MKRSFKLFAGALVMATAILTVASCEKEQINTSKKSVQPEKLLTQHCSPWRNVIGWSNLISELNGFSQCNVSMCTGQYLSTQKTNYLLKNASGQTFYFTSIQTITPTEQSEVMNAALAWAQNPLNKPVGYSISQISYYPEVVTGGSPSTAAITIKVTYIKCTGGGGGGES